jgi:hypothetical protein
MDRSIERLEKAADALAIEWESIKKKLLADGCPADEITWSFHDKLYGRRMSPQERVVAAFSRGEITTA